MSYATSQQFDVPAIREIVPCRLKPWVLLAMVIVYQFSGGIYLAAVNEMVGSTALLQEDIMMAGYASFIGMALVFAIIFRLKSRFSTRATFIICSTILLLCNLVAMSTRSVPLLIVACFVAGFFRMWATFECNSLLHPWISPQHNFHIFFCYIFLLVQGCISLSGMAHAYIAYIMDWQYIHLFVVGLMLVVLIAVALLFNGRRIYPFMPLYGVDWLGMALVGVMSMAFVFVCVYGDHYDWFQSEYICVGAIIAIVAALFNIWRASFIRHPFICNQTLRYPIVKFVVTLYFIYFFLISPAHLLEHIYMEGILGYDLIHSVSLNWAVLAGTIAGAWFTWRIFCIHHWHFLTMLTIAFVATAAYLIIFYLTIDYRLPKTFLILPLFLRGFGYVIVAIVLLAAMQKRVPFPHFFQAVTVQNIVCASLAGAFGTAVLNELLKFVCNRNAMHLSSALDSVNTAAAQLSKLELYAMVQQQALIISVKELFGVLTMVGIVCTIPLMLRKS